MVNVPKFRELSVVKLIEDARAIKEINVYLPDQDPIPRDFLFNVSNFYEFIMISFYRLSTLLIPSISKRTFKQLLDIGRKFWPRGIRR